MATRSRIGIINADKTVSSIYCHYDGYPQGVGQTLLDHFKTKHQVQKLVDLGDISFLKRSTERPLALTAQSQIALWHMDEIVEKLELTQLPWIHCKTFSKVILRSLDIYLIRRLLAG